MVSGQVLGKISAVLWSTLGLLLGILVGFWEALGLSSAALGLSWAALGLLLGRLWRSWEALGLSWAVLGGSWTILGYLGQLLCALGRLWSDLGRHVGAK